MVSGSRTADVVVIGDGLIGLSTAHAVARQGGRCVVFGTNRPGAASPASAGLLVPFLDELGDEIRPFFQHSISLYPGFVADLARHDPELRIIEGMIERRDGEDVLHAADGAVDPVRLLAALRAAIARQSSVELAHSAVEAIEPCGERLAVIGSGHPRVEAGHVILAAGAWSPAIVGLPRELPVQPLKGQMIALDDSPLRRPVMGDDVYLVPRGYETLVGATVEVAGFDVTVTPEAVEWLRAGASELCPELAAARITRSWAGIRPATPDMLPILGPDPDLPALIYACGHAKNGVLLAPGTAQAVAGWCGGHAPDGMLAPFSIGRFIARNS